ncbi:hypothetical protein B0J14DRAFT_562823 [Halenospora varia]|nr:hypothetical protein B0J14DRAFT_562823 [Halenospora varia]
MASRCIRSSYRWVWYNDQSPRAIKKLRNVVVEGAAASHAAGRIFQRGIPISKRSSGGNLGSKYIVESEFAILAACSQSVLRILSAMGTTRCLGSYFSPHLVTQYGEIWSQAYHEYPRRLRALPVVHNDLSLQDKNYRELLKQIPYNRFKSITCLVGTGYHCTNTPSQTLLETIALREGLENLVRLLSLVERLPPLAITLHKWFNHGRWYSQRGAHRELSPFIENSAAALPDFKIPLLPFTQLRKVTSVAIGGMLNERITTLRVPSAEHIANRFATVMMSSWLAPEKDLPVSASSSRKELNDADKFKKHLKVVDRMIFCEALYSEPADRRYRPRPEKLNNFQILRDRDRMRDGKCRSVFEEGWDGEWQGS